MGNPRLTILLVVLLVIAAIVMFTQDAPSSNKRELIQFCDADYCTTAAGAFWAKQDSLDAARFFGPELNYNDEALGAHAGL